MPLDDIGPVGFQQSVGQSSAVLTPLADRANILTRLLIDKVSADDIWRISCAGKELAAFDIKTTGNQQPLANAYSGYPKNNDFFIACENILGYPVSYPVPQGQSLTVKSDGGATGDIDMQYQEVAPNEVIAGQLNHPKGNRIICPLVGYVNALVMAAGEVAFDTQVGPSWFPNIFADGTVPQGWRIRVLAAFLEGGGVNTFNGAANHQSVTSYIGLRKNGQIMYTRAALGGIPLIGAASTAGNANVVVGTDETAFPPFQETNYWDWNNAELPITFDQGNNHALRLAVTGDVTGGADYSKVRQMFIVDVTYPS